MMGQLVTTGIWHVKARACADAAHEWKAQPDFGERIGRVLQHVDKFEPSELNVVAEVTAGAASSA